MILAITSVHPALQHLSKILQHLGGYANELPLTCWCHLHAVAPLGHKQLLHVGDDKVLGLELRLEVLIQIIYFLLICAQMGTAPKRLGF